jgi:hypothetical protein
MAHAFAILQARFFGGSAVAAKVAESLQ